MRGLPGVVAKKETFPEGSVFEGCEGSGYTAGDLVWKDEMSGINQQLVSLQYKNITIVSFNRQF